MISDKRLEELAKNPERARDISVGHENDSIKVLAIELLARRKFAQDQDAGQVAAVAALTAVWGQGYVAGARAEARACASVYESREAWSKRAEALEGALREALEEIERVALGVGQPKRLADLRKILEGK